MTNEEAIKEIEKLDDWISKQPSLLEDWCKTSDALYIATQALKAQPNSNEFFNFDAPMVKNSEAVSRGVLTEYINTMLTSNEEMASNATNEGRWVEEKTYLYGVEILEGLSEYVNDLPSVTPERPKGKWIKIQSGNEDFPESIVCSRCKNENSHLDFDEHSEPIGKIFVTSKYCPNCGSYNGDEEDEAND